MSDPLTDDEIAKQVIGIITEELMPVRVTVTRITSLQGLGVDIIESIRRRLETRFGIKIEDNDIYEEEDDEDDSWEEDEFDDFWEDDDDFLIIDIVQDLIDIVMAKSRTKEHKS